MDCIFCKIINKEIPGKVIYEDENVVAFLDISQATTGHTLIVPKKHSNSIFDTDPGIVSHSFKVAQQLSHRIVNRLDAKGCNILTNAGVAAGQTVSHFHIHIIPRYDEFDGIKIDFTDNSNNTNLEETFVELIK